MFYQNVNSLSQVGQYYQLKGEEGLWTIDSTFDKNHFADAEEVLKLYEYKQVLESNFPAHKLLNWVEVGFDSWVIFSQVQVSFNFSGFSALEEIMRWLARQPKKISDHDLFELNESLLFEEEGKQLPLAIREYEIRALSQLSNPLDVDDGHYSYERAINEKLLTFLLLPSNLSNQIFSFKDISEQFPISVFSQNASFNAYLLSDKSARFVSDLLMRLKEKKNVFTLLEKTDFNELNSEIEKKFKSYQRFFNLKNKCEALYLSNIAKYSEPVYDYFFSLEEILLLNYDNEKMISKIAQSINEGERYAEVESVLKDIDKSLTKLSVLDLKKSNYSTITQAIKRLLSDLDFEHFYFQIELDEALDRSLVKSEGLNNIQGVYRAFKQLDDKINNTVDRLRYKEEIETQSRLLLKRSPEIYEGFLPFISIDINSVENLRSIRTSFIKLNKWVKSEINEFEDIIKIFSDINQLPYKKTTRTTAAMTRLLKAMLENQPVKYELSCLSDALKEQSHCYDLIEQLQLTIKRFDASPEYNEVFLNFLGFFKKELLRYFDFNAMMEKTALELSLSQKKIDSLFDKIQKKDALLNDVIKKLGKDQYYQHKTSESEMLMEELITALLSHPLSETQVEHVLQQLLRVVLHQKINTFLGKVKKDNKPYFTLLETSVSSFLEISEIDNNKRRTLYNALHEFIYFNDYLELLLESSAILSAEDRALLRHKGTLENFEQYYFLEPEKKHELYGCCQEAKSLKEKRGQMSGLLTRLIALTKKNQDVGLEQYLSEASHLVASELFSFKHCLALSMCLSRIDMTLNSQPYKDMVAKIEELRDSNLSALSKSIQKAFYAIPLSERADYALEIGFSVPDVTFKLIKQEKTSALSRFGIYQESLSPKKSRGWFYPIPKTEEPSPRSTAGLEPF